MGDDLFRTINKDNIEKILSRYSYEITAKVLIDRPKGREALYVEAINDLGDKLYIELDNDGSLSVDKRKDHIFYEADWKNKTDDSDSPIPQSLLISSYRNIDNGTSGIAIRCDSGLYIIKSNDTSLDNPIQYEKTYFRSNRSDALIPIKSHDNTLCNYSLYPIIRLSDLQEFPDLVKENTHRTAENLRKLSYIHEKRDLLLLRSRLDTLIKSYDEFLEAEDIASDNLNKSLTELNKLRNYYVENDADERLSPELANRKKAVIDNIEKRHQLGSNLILVSQKINSDTDKIDKLVDKLKRYTQYVKNEFSDMDRIL